MFPIEMTDFYFEGADGSILEAGLSGHHGDYKDHDNNEQSGHCTL